jgi:MoaA/NifB/PqqE/SkfB family radical SAM enzyme
MYPLSFKEFLEAIQDSGIPVTLTTNGTRIDQTKIRSLIDEGLFLIDISLDAFSPENRPNS